MFSSKDPWCSCMSGMRSSRVWLKRQADNAKVATVLASILASSDRVESEGRQMKQCLITYIKIKKSKNSPLMFLHLFMIKRSWWTFCYAEICFAVAFPSPFSWHRQNYYILSLSLTFSSFHKGMLVAILLVLANCGVVPGAVSFIYSILYNRSTDLKQNIWFH